MLVPHMFTRFDLLCLLDCTINSTAAGKEVKEGNKYMYNTLAFLCRIEICVVLNDSMFVYLHDCVIKFHVIDIQDYKHKPFY